MFRLCETAPETLSQGAVTPAYQGNVEKTIEILQTVLSTEIVCVLRYTQHAVAATGISSEAIKKEFATHAREEQAHMMAVAERINQLGGTPDFSPDLLTSRSASQYAEGKNLVDIIRKNSSPSASRSIIIGSSFAISAMTIRPPVSCLRASSEPTRSMQTICTTCWSRMMASQC